MARTFPFFAAGATALAAASLAAAAPQRPAAIQPSAQTRQLAQEARELELRPELAEALPVGLLAPERLELLRDGHAGAEGGGDAR